MNISHIIYTYDRIDDAKIAQELSKTYLNYFDTVQLIHCYNGKKEFQYTKYLEDILIVRENLGHFLGAEDLINAGVLQSLKKSNIQYTLVSAADTWLLDGEFLRYKTEEMRKKKKILFSCSWDDIGGNENFQSFATDFFIFENNWVKNNSIFPLDLANYTQIFRESYLNIFHRFPKGNPYLENHLAYQYISYVKKIDLNSNIEQKAKNLFLRFHEREPIMSGDIRKMIWDNPLFITSHKPIDKKVFLLKNNFIPSGENMKKLIESSNLEYYNTFAPKLVKKGKKIL